MKIIHCKLIISLLLLFQLQLDAQVGQAGAVNIFDASTIPESLKKDAYSVKRKEKFEIAIESPSRAVIRHYNVISVIDRKGLYRLSFGEYTDKFHLLEEVEIKLYNSKGKLISKFKKKDLMNTIAGSGLVPDGKYYYMEFNETDLPLTLETYSVVEFKGVFSLPDYIIQYPWESVEQSSMTISYPSDMKVNYKTYNGNFKPSSSTDVKVHNYTFDVAMQAAKKNEEFSGPWRNYFPYVIFNSDKFEYGGLPGNMSSWKDFGYWYYNGTKGLNQLLANYQQEIKSMVVGVTDNREKVRIIYQYLQKNFRYVSIQLGIGGLIPFPATFLHEKKYGDCKGLSNYMQACLSAVNIKSYQVLINAGTGEPAVDPQFPHNGFNHVILTVPLGKDSIWLECTSNYNDFGHLGAFTENRNGLIITENGGVLARTPTTRATGNMVSTKTKVEINEDGSGQINSSQMTSGDNKYDQVNVSKEKEDYQKSYMINRLGYLNPDDYSIHYGDEKLTPYPVEYSLAVEKLPDFIAGSKMFIRPRMYRFWGIKMPAVEKRTQDIQFEGPICKIDTTTFLLPEGFAVDVLPSSKKIEVEYGSFTSKYWFDVSTRTVFSTAHLELNEYRIPSGKYVDTKLFMDKILEDENQKLIIKKL